jgi:hypothetical protein
MLTLQTLIPALMSFSNMSWDDEDGPIVAMILARLMKNPGLNN